MAIWKVSVMNFMNFAKKDFGDACLEIWTTCECQLDLFRSLETRFKTQKENERQEKLLLSVKKKHNSPNLLPLWLSNNHHNLRCHHPCHHDYHQEELQVLPSFVAQQMIRDIAMEEEKTHGTESPNSIILKKKSKRQIHLPSLDFGLK